MKEIKVEFITIEALHKGQLYIFPETFKVSSCTDHIVVLNLVQNVSEMFRI